MMLTTSPETCSIYSSTNEKRVTGYKGTIIPYVIIIIITITKIISSRGEYFASIFKSFLFNCIASAKKW